MRTAAIAIALLLGGTAFAQTTTTTQPDVDVDVGVQPDGDPDVDLDVGTKTKTTTYNADGTATTVSTSTANSDTDTPDVTTTTATGTTVVAANVTPPMNPVVQPSNANPERDARGIAVISDPAVVPAGFNGTTGTGVGGPMVDPATGATMTGADASHPPCTATVTDNCVQTYERGRRR
ncbi:MAG TPA: hypothetical protein VFP12_11045 [Allosphingosinicella sp.]|nr:hypothetical protein [Allosphingosinicella sp.]